MEEILHQFAGSLSHYLQGFLHPGWCRISSIWHIVGLEEACSATQLHWVQQSWRSDKRPRGTAAPLIVRWLHLHVIKQFDQILQCILVVEGIESKTIHQSISSQFLGLFHLPRTSKSLVKLGGEVAFLSLGGSHLVGLRHALQHQVLRPEMWKTQSQSQNLHFCNFCPANYGCNISDSTESAVDFIPKKTSQKFMVIFSFVESSRRCEKKTWELRYLGREESSWWWSSVLFVLMKLLRVFLGFRNVISLNRLEVLFLNKH